MIQLSYCLKDVFVENDFYTNVFIVAFTTSNIRIRLYDMVCFITWEIGFATMTDSVVYVDDGFKPLKLGRSLGDMENEI
jgi:hypothetical protein